MLQTKVRSACQHFLVILAVIWGVQHVNCEIEDNTINEDGSYSFRHSNDDIGSYYHSASGTPDIVRGRYGSRNPASGQVEEVIYTAGPRGFRANGPKIHRKMDLAQFPVRPMGTPYDPLADPYDDPSYSFNFRTSDQSRSENSDANGQVRGLYSYIDDVGDRHSVRYAAGAGTGFEVVNAVPDSPSNVGYTGPLYKASPRTRGKMSVQRGPDGTYKLIAAGPDHRRAESRASDGLVRGTYSFLDDKGIQRTVEYIAGAGIGYRVIQNVIGPGTHVNPSVSDFRLSDTDFRLANDFGRGAGPVLGGSTASVGSSGGGTVGRAPNSVSGSANRKIDNAAGAGRGRISNNGNNNRKQNNDDESYFEENDTTGRWASGTESRSKTDRMGTAGNSNRGNTRYQGGGNGGSNASNNRRPDDIIPNRGGSSMKSANRNNMRPPNNRNNMNAGDSSNNRYWERDSNMFSDSRNDGSTLSSAGSSGSGVGYNIDEPSAPSSNNNNFNDDIAVLPPLVTSNRKILEIEKERDWAERHRDSTLIKNVGKWYIGLPPGQTVRAHVQNIDLLPQGGRRVQSPSEALRADEIAEMAASFESDTQPKRRSRTDKKP